MQAPCILPDPGFGTCILASAPREREEGAQLRPLGSLPGWEKAVVASPHLADCHQRVGHVGKLFK
jgi:hypothetical protein